MASSRWKRFAFFERSTLALPDAVWDSDFATAAAPPLSSPSGTTTTTRMSVAVSTAALPARTKPTFPPSSSAAAPASSAAAVAPKKNAATATTTATAATSNAAVDTALAAMWSSLTACSSPAAAAAAAATNTGALPGDSSVVRLPSQAATLPSASSSLSSSLSSASSAAISAHGDGLVLAFLAAPFASAAAPRIHCVDVTVRCNPPPPAIAATAAGTATAAASEDLDGWRGYWSPFPPTTAATTTTTTQAAAAAAADAASRGASGVVAVAACRVPPPKPVGAAAAGPAHSPLHVTCLGGHHHQLVVWEDPHLHLSCRLPAHDTVPSADAVIYTAGKWHAAHDGEPRVLDSVPGLVAVGTDSGVVVVYTYNTAAASSRRFLRPYLRIPAPPVVAGVKVVSVQWSQSALADHIFVAYNTTAATGTPAGGGLTAAAAAGVCCYDLPPPPFNTWSQQQQQLLAPSARHDLDGRYVGATSLVDVYGRRQGGQILTVARPDGLYSYSHTERTGVAPIDGTKLAICIIPPPLPAELVRAVDANQVGAGYALVASTDAKSGRDAVDIYDSTNKLVAFHLLLSPGHHAIRAAGVTTPPTHLPDGTVRGGRSSAVVLTTGGALVTFTEKLTEEKISLLVQKNLYSAAIVVAYADPSYDASDITTLYQRYAEHLYRKGDYSSAIDQYVHTIGSLESSHVIFRYLDAPKIPLLVRYLEKLRSRELATPVHNELLRTCYLKLNDMQAADAIAVSASWSVNDASLESILSNLSSKPKDALATICSLEAHQAAEVLVIHGASLARALPRETAGVVISLCVGSYTPKALADASMAETLEDAAATTTAAAIDLKRMVNTNDNPKAVVIDPYPVHLFASAFVEHPKILRLLLAHCNRNKSPLTPSLRRTLLELTLAEWNQAKRSGDTEAEKLRHKEAIASLTDSHSHDIGDYDALVIVQLAGFEEGELLLYERLQMTPVLLERYAKDGSEKARRQMLAMCQTDPEILADVLGHFVEIASEKFHSHRDRPRRATPDDGSDDDETDEIMEDIQEALTLVRRQGVLPPVRVARILAGEGAGQFSSDRPVKDRKKTVPLSVALDYVGTVLEKSRKEASRLKSEIEEYNQLCNSMENEIDSLLRASYALPPPSAAGGLTSAGESRLNIDELLIKVKSGEGGAAAAAAENVSAEAREAFWREMNQTEDSFDTISRFFAKGVIG